MMKNKTNKKILVFLGHPDSGKTTNDRLANAYQKGAEEAGHEVRRLDLAKLDFDPVLHKGYREIQELEPDLKRAQKDIRWADHIALFYPVWWSSMPALLKGFFDRVWLPGFAFKFVGDFRWKKLLKGRTARVVATSDSPAIGIYLVFGDYTNEIKHAICGFAGIRTKIDKIGGLKGKGDKHMKKLEKKMYKKGRKGK